MYFRSLFRISIFGFRIYIFDPCFEFRASDFEFIFYTGEAMTPYPKIHISRVRTCSARERISKVTTDLEAGPIRAGMTMREFLDAMPGILKADAMKAIALAVVKAKKKNKPVIAMIGGHVIKTGCSPVLAGLVENGNTTTWRQKTARRPFMIRNLPDLAIPRKMWLPELEDGSFGMAEDTATLVNEAARQSAASKETPGEGFGEAVGRLLSQEAPPHLNRALTHECFRLKIPYTLHVALGTDIVHQHPSASGAAIGEALEGFPHFLRHRFPGWETEGSCSISEARS